MTSDRPYRAALPFQAAREAASKDSSTIGQILSMGLARQGAVRRRDDIELAMEQALIEIMPELKEVAAWPTVGHRRTADEVGRIAEHPVPDDWMYEAS